MKRTITDLEQKLIEKGFRLDHKTYAGKHSQFVNEFVYIGFQDVPQLDHSPALNVWVEVKLNAKRDRIISVITKDLLSFEGISLELANVVYDICKYIENDIRKCEE